MTPLTGTTTYGGSFRQLFTGRKIQISKYTNDLLITGWRIQTLNSNKKDGRCFACQNLWEDMTHILTCSCAARGPARTVAWTQFQQKLSHLHTPDISMMNLICNSMDSWLERCPVFLPVWDGPHEPILMANSAVPFMPRHKSDGISSSGDGLQKNGSNQSTHPYYKIRQPGGDTYTSDQLMCTVIKELCGSSQYTSGNNKIWSYTELTVQYH